MYKYETHLHTFPVSKCASADVSECLEFYKKLGYDGVFITNHFIDGNINISSDASYEDKINFYFSDYEKAKDMAESVGIKVFCGIEMSYKGTDFLVYGIDKKWILENPQIAEMKKTEQLKLLDENGALIIQAHPYREAVYIDHIRLFPRSVHGVEIINASGNDATNSMAKIYAEHYDLLKFAGSDNHVGNRMKRLAGMCSDFPVNSEKEFAEAVKMGRMEPFLSVQ